MAEGERTVRILVVQNDVDKGPGRVGDALVAAGAELDVRMATDDLPSVADYDGLLVLPGLNDPADDLPPVHRARAAITEALALDRPVLGLCLGGQLLAQATGGEAYRCQVEQGYHDVRSTAAAQEDALLAGAPELQRWRIGGWTDPLLALLRGYPAASILSVGPGYYPHYHHPSDLPEFVNYESVAACARIAAGTVEAWDRRFAA